MTLSRRTLFAGIAAACLLLVAAASTDRAGLRQDPSLAVTESPIAVDDPRLMNQLAPAAPAAMMRQSLWEAMTIAHR